MERRDSQLEKHCRRAVELAALGGQRLALAGIGAAAIAGIALRKAEVWAIGPERAQREGSPIVWDMLLDAFIDRHIEARDAREAAEDAAAEAREAEAEVRYHGEGSDAEAVA